MPDADVALSPAAAAAPPLAAAAALPTLYSRPKMPNATSAKSRPIAKPLTSLLHRAGRAATPASAASARGGGDGILDAPPELRAGMARVQGKEGRL